MTVNPVLLAKLGNTFTKWEKTRKQALRCLCLDGDVASANQDSLIPLCNDLVKIYAKLTVIDQQLEEYLQRSDRNSSDSTSVLPSNDSDLAGTFKLKMKVYKIEEVKKSKLDSEYEEVSLLLQETRAVLSQAISLAPLLFELL